MLSKEDLSIFKVASKDKARPVLTGVLFRKIEYGTGYGIQLAATDGYRLVEKTISVDYEPTFDTMIIPAETIQDLSKLLSKKRKVLISDNQFKILNTKYVEDGVLEKTLTIGKKIEGDYPAYQDILPSDDPVVEITLDAKYIAEAMTQSQSGKVTLQLFDKNKALIVRDGFDNTDILAAVMPLKS